MLATCILEIALAIYAIFRYRLNEITRLAVWLLVLLAVFQAAEYNVCESGFIDSLWAARIGYVAITFLPPLGIHLAYALAATKKRPLLPWAYASGGAFAVYFLLATQGLSGHACMGNYVIFQQAPGTVWLYTLYYFGWILATMWLCFRLATSKTKLSLLGLAFAYAIFIVPTTMVNIASPDTIAGIPSIMCGFAVGFAVILVMWILPKTVPKIPKR